MYKRILVPLDGSELAEVVFTYAKELAGRLGLEVVLLHVYNPDEHELAALHRAYVEHKAEIVKRESQEVQGKIGIRSEGKPLEVRGEVAAGYPAEEILRYADENDIDLILMANRGRSGVRRWPIGSVAEKVLRASNVPVWLVRAGFPEEITYDKWPSRTILVPLDGSELAEAVLPHVEALTKQAGAEMISVVLLKVCEYPIVPFSPEYASEYRVQKVAEDEALTVKYLDGVRQRLKNAGVTAQSKILVGKPAERIIEYVKTNPFSLIVMSTHAHSGFSQWVYGSVAAKVLEMAPSPILLVRPRQADLN